MPTPRFPPRTPPRASPAPRARAGRAGPAAGRGVVAPVARELLILEVLEIEQRVVRALGRADQLVELDLHRLGVAVLRVLDEEHHEEGDDRGRSVDYELPGIAQAEDRP